MNESREFMAAVTERIRGFRAPRLTWRRVVVGLVVVVVVTWVVLTVMAMMLTARILGRIFLLKR